jgi:hypothetical protein
VTGTNLTEEFADKLEEAKSNLPEFGNGKVIFQKLVLEPNAKYLNLSGSVA